MSRVCWSPTRADHFIVFSSDLCLYEARNGAACELARNTSLTFVKCIAWHPDANYDYVIAVGHANGHVRLTSAFEDHADPQSILRHELSCSKHPRSVHALSWNPKFPQYLAIGLDKGRSDAALVIWDVLGRNEAGFPIHFDPPNYDSRRGSIDPTVSYQPPRQAWEAAASDSIFSLDWFPGSPKLLACGSSNKSIKLFDMRTLSKPCAVIPSKAVYGIKVDPYDDAKRFLSYTEHQLYIWDIRNYEKPCLACPAENKPIVKAQWDSTQDNVVSSLCRESDLIKVYHIQRILQEDGDLGYIERHVRPPFTDRSNSIIASYDWHPTQLDRLLALSNSGALCHCLIQDRISFAWSQDCDLVFAAGRQVVRCCMPLLDQNGAEIDEDISLKMRRRALDSYGIHKNAFEKHAKLCSQDPPLSWAWHWLAETNETISRFPPNYWRYDCKFPGVKAVIQRMPRTASEYARLSAVDNSSGHLTMKLYKSTDRDRILALCGWGPATSSKTALDSLVAKMVDQRQVERAACITLLMLNLRGAVEMLTHAYATSQDNLQLVGMALAGFQGLSERDSYVAATNPPVWFEVCRQVLPSLKNPYLRVMFHFLSSKLSPDGTFASILEEPQFPLYDKVGFAACYLNDQNLRDFIIKTTRTAVEQGDLYGLLLTGLGTPESWALLKNYVDRTGDVQSAALLCLHGQMEVVSTTQDGVVIDVAPVLGNSTAGVATADPAVAKQQAMAAMSPPNFLEAYRCLLNRWGLWHNRAHLDMLRQEQGMQSKQNSSQVFLGCTYCTKPLTLPVTRPQSRQQRSNSCNACRKPLPRCAVCRAYMGAPVVLSDRIDDEPSPPKPLDRFGSWFSWCQTCRHGGHAQHLLQWFKERSECPVTGCTCKCAELGVGSKMLSADGTFY